MLNIHHVGLTVRDLDTSIAFYHGVLGLELFVAPNAPVEGPGVARSLGVEPPAALRVALFRIGEGDSMIELLQYLSPPSTTGRALVQNNVGASHVALHVADARTWIAKLEAAGVEFVSNLNVLDEGALAGWRWVYFKDPDGHTLELVEVAYATDGPRQASVAAYLAEHPIAHSH